jgi:methylenetetrahydrofolate dehydrogenase (NADP+)/methenyltetrahydrofolate cyclohydrolase
MNAKILEGKSIAQSILQELQERIQRERLSPTLAVLSTHHPLVSEKKDRFLREMARIGKEAGVTCHIVTIPATSSTADFIQTIHELNADAGIQGIFLHLPFPGHLNIHKIIQSIAPAKDVGGLHPHTTRRILKMKPIHRDPRVEGIVRLIQVATRNHLLSEKFGVILSDNLSFSRVMAQTLYQTLGISTETPRTLSPMAQRYLQRADIVITTLPTLRAIRHDIIKEGAIVIDATIPGMESNRVDHRLHPSLYAKAAWVSHASSGVQPIRLALILANVVSLR